MNALLRHSGAALVAALGAPVGAMGLLLRPGWREGVRERLGLAGPTVPGAVWVHGASVGEILAATRLVDELQARGHTLLASTTTTTGQAVLAHTRPELPRRLAPLDHLWCATASLRRARPAALVMVETDLWPTWIAAAQRMGVAVAVVSGRISDRSLRSYQRLGPVLRGTFSRMDAVGARSAEDARRFLALGFAEHCVRVTGDLKLEPPAAPAGLASDLAALLGNAEPLVGASTHVGEEMALLDAVEAAELAGGAIPLVLAPRHLERADEVAREVLVRGLKLRRRSQPDGRPLADGEVLLLDSMGELPGVIGRALAVFVGGSLVPRGGHNVLEPAHAGRATLFGPHTENVRQAADRLLACGGARRVADADELTAAVVELVLHPERAHRQGSAARREIDRHRGAAARSADLVESLLVARR